jgi:threonine aldolase
MVPGSLVRDHAQLADSVHQPRTRLVVVENTHNTAGGRAWPLPQLDALYDAGLPVEPARVETNFVLLDRRS